MSTGDEYFWSCPNCGQMVPVGSFHTCPSIPLPHVPFSDPARYNPPVKSPQERIADALELIAERLKK
jgi:hypothetical protein